MKIPRFALKFGPIASDSGGVVPVGYTEIDAKRRAVRPVESVAVTMKE